MWTVERREANSRPWEFWAGIGAWVGAAVLTAVLIAARYVAAMSQVQPDFSTFFVSAARAIGAGASPYTIEGYFYTPVVAILIVPFSNAIWAQAAWTVAMLTAATGMALFGVLACTPNWRSYHRAWLFVIAIVTLLWSWPITMEFFWGQVNLFVGFAIALAAYFATRGWYFASGIGLGLAAAIKSWPILLVLWVARRGRHARAQTMLAIAVWGVVLIVLTLTLGGGSALAAMLSGPFRGTNQPDVIAYSAWGLGKALFGGVRGVEPLAESPVARLIVTAAVGAVAVGLLIVVLRRPGGDVISLYNTAFVIILLLPISHQVYLLLPLPALWWWTAEAARSPVRIRNWMIVGILIMWWVICFRLAYQLGPDKETAVATVVAIVTSTLIAAAASTIGAASISRGAQSDADSAGAGISRTGGAA